MEAGEWSDGDGRSEGPGGADPRSVGAVFAVLADRNRRRMIERIVTEGPVTATTLSREMGITRQGAAKHLVVMADAGVLTSTKTGSEVHYRLVPGALESSSDWSARMIRLWGRLLEVEQARDDG